MRKLALLIIAALTLIACAHPADAAPKRRATTVGLVTEDRAYQYSASDSFEHLTVTYSPDRTNAPWIMLIHGGSWINGTRANEADAAAEFANYGWQVFNIEYERGDGVTLAQQMSDLQSARGFIEAHYGQYHLDPTKGTLYGFSAGGHLATLLATDNDPDVKAVVSVDGIVQPARIANDAAGARPDTEPATEGLTNLSIRESQFMGCDFPGSFTDPSACGVAWARFCPETQINADTPPEYLVNGLSDPVNPYQAAQAYSYHLAQAGVASKVVLVASDGTGNVGTHNQANAIDHGPREAAMRSWIVSNF